MTTARHRTSSELRFLLTERAALAGSVARIAKDQLPLQAELASLEAQARQTRDRLAAMQSVQLNQEAELKALDRVLQYSYPGVDPASVGSVAAWAGKYGRRGELKAFIHAALQGAYPAGVPTQGLLEAIVTRFALAATKEDFIRLRHVVVSRLSQSMAEGLVHSRPGVKLSSSVWFWNAGPSAAGLLDYAATSEAFGDPQPHTFRAEVGG